MRSIVGGREGLYDLHRGLMGVVPADGATHTVVVSTDRPTQAFLLLFPLAVMESFAAKENIMAEIPERMTFDAPGLCECLVSLSRLTRHADDRLLAAERADEALLMAIEHLTGRRPAWRVDRSPFDRPTFAFITSVIDEQLANPPGLTELGMRVGLSPGHCAAKFRTTTGMNLSHYCHLRRIQRAFILLREPEPSLARMALDLGFASQSHFTRVFSSVTGMTPAKYRRTFRRKVPSGVAVG